MKHLLQRLWQGLKRYKGTLTLLTIMSGAFWLTQQAQSEAWLAIQYTQDLYHFGALNPANFFAHPLQESFRLLSNTFLHLNAAHFFGNMEFFLLTAFALETWLGTRRFLNLYFYSAIFASLFQAYASPQAFIILGASGAIFAMIGATIIYGLRHNKKYLAYASIPFTMAIFPEIIALLNPAIDGIGHAAHQGGFLFGMHFFLAERVYQKRIYTNQIKPRLLSTKTKFKQLFQNKETIPMGLAQQ